MAELDLESFRLGGDEHTTPMTSTARSTGRVVRQKRADWFVKGPLPGDWVARAAALPGKALAVGIALSYLAGLEKTKTVKPTGKVWQRFNITHDAGTRGLRALEREGLIEVVQRRGCSPWVTILHTPD